jgi:hypothetical protein
MSEGSTSGCGEDGPCVPGGMWNGEEGSRKAAWRACQQMSQWLEEYLEGQRQTLMDEGEVARHWPPSSLKVLEDARRDMSMTEQMVCAQSC